MIVYLMTLTVAGAMAARAILLTAGDCDTLAKRIAENDPLYHSSRSPLAARPCLCMSGPRECRRKRRGNEAQSIELSAQVFHVRVVVDLEGAESSMPRYP
jgi:hypothetical protein